MQRLLVLLAMTVAVTTLLAEGDPVVAHVVDRIADRVPLQTVAPEYPRKARRDRIEGRVEVCFDIDRKGRPRRIAVRNSSNRAFEKPSIKAVRVSTFRPLNDDEELQSIKSCRTFIFSLEPVAVQAVLIYSPRYAEGHHQRKYK
jgi:TonB family protein